jgi:hypothetical protein
MTTRISTGHLTIAASHWYPLISKLGNEGEGRSYLGRRPCLHYLPMQHHPLPSGARTSIRSGEFTSSCNCVCWLIREKALRCLSIPNCGSSDRVAVVWRMEQRILRTRDCSSELNHYALRPAGWTDARTKNSASQHHQNSRSMSKILPALRTKELVGYEASSAG